MFLHIERVSHLHAFELRLEFTNGVTKDVDLGPELFGEVFEPLRKPELFRRVIVNPETGTIEWPNGADFAPEYLYEIGKTVQQVA
jgi:hypothetical protein